MPARPAMRTGRRASTRDARGCAATKSSPSTSPGALGASARAPLLRPALPSCQTAKPTSGRTSAWRRTASTQCASSVASVFRNLRRAGVLKNSSRTSTVVPTPRAAGRSSPERASSRNACVGVGGAAGERELGDRGDRRQRLAAKAHRRDALELGERGDLAGGVAAQRQRQLVGGMPSPSSSTTIARTPPADQAHDDLRSRRRRARCRPARAPPRPAARPPRRRRSG